MRYTRLMVAMLLATATLTAVACSTSSDDMSGSAVTGGEPVQPEQPGQGGEEPSGGEQPGGSGGEQPGGGGAEQPAGGGGEQPGAGAKPGEPINPSGGSTGGGTTGGGSTGSQGYADPADYLNSLSPTQRVDWAGIEDACDPNSTCPETVANFETYLQTICPQKTGCTDAVANLLYNTRSASMKSSGTFPATFPQAKDVLAALEAMSAAGGANSAEPAPVAAMDEIVAEVTTAIAADTDGTVTWEDIRDAFADKGESGEAVADALEEAMKNPPAGATHSDTIEALVKGESVSAADAAAALVELAEGLG